MQLQAIDAIALTLMTTISLELQQNEVGLCATVYILQKLHSWHHKALVT